MSWMDGLSVGLVRRALRDHQRQFFSVHRQCEKINFYRFIEIKKIRYQLKNIYYAVDCCICHRQLNAWNDTDVGRTYKTEILALSAVLSKLILKHARWWSWRLNWWRWRHRQHRTCGQSGQHWLVALLTTNSSHKHIPWFNHVSDCAGWLAGWLFVHRVIILCVPGRNQASLCFDACSQSILITCALMHNTHTHASSMWTLGRQEHLTLTNQNAISKIKQQQKRRSIELRQNEPLNGAY